MLARIQPFFDDRFVFATLTQRKKGSTAPYKKVQVRPFLQSGELSFQLTWSSSSISMSRSSVSISRTM